MSMRISLASVGEHVLLRSRILQNHVRTLLNAYLIDRLLTHI